MIGRQELADKLTNQTLTEIYGERFTNLKYLEDDAELDNEWEIINDRFYNALSFYYGDDD